MKPFLQIFALSYCLLAFKGPTAFAQSTSAASTYDDENIDSFVDDLGEDIQPEVTEKDAEGPKKKTLAFLKELRNITKEAGDFLKLRCEVGGTVPASDIKWYKNDAPLVVEKNRMKIKTNLDGDVQWSTLRFKIVETLDTAFYECRVSNDIGNFIQ